VLAIVAAAFNVVASPVMRVCEGDRGAMLLIVPIVVGVMMGQIPALALWLLCGEGTFLRRLMIHWGVGLGLFAAACLGFALATVDQQFWNGDEVAQSIATILCFLPGISLLTQLPLWPLVTYFGWRVKGQGTASAAAKSQPLSILDLLAGTGVVAVTLGLLRAAPIGDRWFVWSELIPVMIAAVLVSLFVMLPAVIFLLRWQEAAVGAGVYAAYLFCGLTTLIIAVSAAFNSAGPGEGIVAIFAGTFALGATVASPLLVWRSCGYRLIWPRDRAAGRP
jgi:hypothetical protein